MSQGWTEVGRENDFGDKLMLATIGEKKIVIGRAGGALVACVAKCPHGGISMEHAEVEGTIWTCPLHGWRFDMTQRGSEIHGFRGLEMCDLKVESGVVFVADQARMSPATGIERVAP